GSRGGDAGGMPRLGLPRRRQRNRARRGRPRPLGGPGAARAGPAPLGLPPGGGGLHGAAAAGRPVRTRRRRGTPRPQAAVRPAWHTEPRTLDGGRVTAEQTAADRHALRFVGEDIPALADLQNCIHCGFCLPSCPTYVATGQELESPRGRLHLIHGVLTGRTEASDRLLGHLDLCLQCRACETACPSSVPYGRIMEDARAAIMANPARERPRSWTLRAFVLREVLARPRRVRAALTLGRLYSRTGLQRAVRGPLRRWLPASLARLEALAPVLDRPPFRQTGALTSPSVRPESPSSAPRVALLLGCVHGELYPQMHEAT